MSQNQEIIESKLCAYIDGELDADGRTEIEKHLDANPQHRRLLESLKATRDLIKWLPREPAPPELAETLNGQLERSVLLDFDERSLNQNIWPRFLSAAAIVLLTAGLGAAVYFTLPKSQKNATPYASRAMESQSPMPDGIVPEASTEPAKPDDALVASAPMEKTAMPLMATKAMADRTPSPELDQLARDVSQNGAAIVAVATGAGPAMNLQQPSTMPANAMVMLVQANSTEQATRDVTTYLESQNIRWKPAALAAISSPATSQVGGHLAEGARESLQGEAMNREARRVMQNEPTTRPDMPGSALTSLGQLQTNQSQQILSPATGFYVARMSRQQAIDLNNSVRQRKSQQSELKDLSASSTAARYQYPEQNQAQEIARADKQSGQGQAAAPPRTAAAAPPMPPDQSQGSAFNSGKPSTQQGIGGFGGGRGGGFGSGFDMPQGGGLGARGGAATEPATTPPTSQVATTEPTDAPVDVVIVVQPDSTAATEPAPSVPQTEAAATQPAIATSPPQTQPASH